MSYKIIQTIINSLFFWLPTGENLENRKYIFGVWLVLGLQIIYSINLGDSSREISKQNTVSPQFNLISRYSLGTKQILDKALSIAAKSGSSNLNKNQTYNLLFKEIYAAVSSDRDKTAFAVLRAEFFGIRSALDYLSSLENMSKRNSWFKQEIALFKAAYSENKKERKLSSSDKQYLKDHYLWFGELLLVQGEGSLEENLVRTEIYKHSSEITRKIIFMVLFIGSIFITSFIINIAGFSRGKHKNVIFKIDQEGPNPVKGRIVLIESLILFLGFIFLSSLTMGRISGTLGMMVYFLSFSAIIWPLFRNFNPLELQHILGLTKGEGVLKEIMFGLKAYLHLMPLLLTGILLSMFLVNITGETPVHPVAYKLETGNFFTIVKWVFIGSFFAPVVEELIFRGAFYHYFRQRYSFGISAFITSLIFAMIHPQGYAAIPAITAMGISLSLMRELRYSIIAPVTAHILNNSVIIIFMTSLF